MSQRRVGPIKTTHTSPSRVDDRRGTHLQKVRERRKVELRSSGPVIRPGCGQSTSRVGLDDRLWQESRETNESVSPEKATGDEIGR